MKQFATFFIFIALAGHGAARAIASPQDDQNCRQLLNYIYRDVTLKNMRLSLERLNKKMTLAFVAALRSSHSEGKSLRSDPDLLSLFESMKKIDPDFERHLQNNAPYRSYNFWSFLPFARAPIKIIAYQEGVSAWKDLQKKRPELFSGLEDRHLLDEWDLKTAHLLQSHASLKVDDGELAAQVEALGKQYQNNLQNISAGVSTDYQEALSDTKQKVDELHQAFNGSAKDLFWQSLNDFQHVCSKDGMARLLKRDSLACPYVEPESSAEKLSGQLREISQIVGADLVNNARAPEAAPESPIVDIVPYRFANINYEGSFCKRPPELADTVVIHHSASSDTDSPQTLHDLQIMMRENSPSPWYMIGYNYLVSSPPGQETTVFEGRGAEMKGAHAGGFVNLDQVDPPVRELLKNSEIKCGWNTDGDSAHTIDVLDKDSMRQNEKYLRQGFVSGNVTSVGILVIGNYAPDLLGTSINPGGYPSNGPIRYPSDNVLRTTAKSVCRLKSESHPNLRKLTDHNYMKIKKALADGNSAIGTCCPGTVYKRMSRLLALVKEECPEHEFVLDISPEDKICPFLRNIQ